MKAVAVLAITLLWAAAPAVDSDADLLDLADSALSQNRLAEAEADYRLFLERADVGAAPDLELVRALSGLGTALVLQSRARRMPAPLALVRDRGRLRHLRVERGDRLEAGLDRARSLSLPAPPGLSP
jgi:hypothetical protein